MLITILSKLRWIRAESDLPLQLISAMQIALFATLLTLAFTSSNASEEYELLIKNDDMVATKSTVAVGILPAAETEELSTEKGLTSIAISRIKTALSLQIDDQLNKAKDNHSLLEVIEDDRADERVNENAKQSSIDPADVVPSSRVPKSRINGKKDVLENENSYDKKRMEVITRMDCFIKKYKNHPLDNLVSTVMKTLTFFDEAKASEAWADFGEKRRNFVLLCFSEFVERLVTLKQLIYQATDDKCPMVHYGPNGTSLEVRSTTKFDSIVSACETLSAKMNSCNSGDRKAATKLEKRDLLVFVEVLLDLIDQGTLYDAVEIDIFSPLYELLEEVEKASCGFYIYSRQEQPLSDSCMRFFSEIKDELKKVIALLTHDNRDKPGYLKIRRFRQPEPMSSSNVPQARPRTRETQLISTDAEKLFAFQVAVSVSLVLMVLFQVFLLVTKWG